LYSNEADKKEEEKKEDKKEIHQAQLQVEKSLRPAKYRVYTADEKRSFIALAKSPNQNPENTAKLKGIGPTNIRRWSKEFDNNVMDFGRDLRAGKSGRQVKHPQLDEYIKRWFSRLREAKVSVSGVMVFTEAQSYVNLHNLQDIKLSKGWHHKLLKRLKIVKRKQLR